MMVSIIFIILLAMLIIFGNLTVIGLFLSNPKSRNSQCYYKFSIAVADILIGLIILPSIVNYMLRLSLTRLNYQPLKRQHNSTFRGGLFFKEHANIFDTASFNFIGFATVALIAVCTSTLLFASVDRHISLSRPTRHCKHKAKARAKIICVTIWISAIVFGIIPILHSEMAYTLDVSTFVTPRARVFRALFILTLVITLIPMQILTFITYRACAKRMLIRSKSKSRSKKNVFSEARLAGTLAVMVGVFTVCTLSLIVMSLYYYFNDRVKVTKSNSFNINEYHRFKQFHFIAVVIFLSNSLWNCLIYSVRNEKFRVEAIRMYKCIFKYCKPKKRFSSNKNNTIACKHHTCNVIIVVNNVSNLTPQTPRKSIHRTSRTKDLLTVDKCPTTAKCCSIKYRQGSSETQESPIGSLEIFDTESLTNSVQKMYVM